MPVGNQGYSNTDWARSVETTFAKHIPEVEEAWMRSFPIGALIESRGNIVYNQDGRGFDWEVQYRKHPMEGNDGTTTRNFVPQNLWKLAFLPYRGYQCADSFTEKELMENRGESARIKLADRFIARMESSVKQSLPAEFYIDGEATGNTKRWHGFESFMGISGTITFATAGAVTQAANAADAVGYPSDTYAGLSTILGIYNGEGDSVLSWPQGSADSEFDFWSPPMFNAQSTCALFPSATQTWAGQGDEVLRYAILTTQRNSGVEGMTDTALTDRNFYSNFLNLIDGKEQINIVRGESQSLVSLGFKNTVNFDGIEVTWDTACPANVVYGFNPSDIDLRCMYDSIFTGEGPFYDEHTQRYNAVVRNLGNLKFKSPRGVFKIYNIV